MGIRLRLTLFVSLFMAITFVCAPLSAAPGAITTEPLLTSSRVDPNIMLSLDSSGSMNHIVMDSPFDPSVVYFNCPSSLALPTSSSNTVEIRVNWNTGQPYFRYGFSTYDWGITPGRGPTNREKRCFRNDVNYLSALYANANFYYAKAASGYGNTSYPGNYLNWYFGTSPTSWGSDARAKPGTERRIEVQRDVANGVIDELENVRIGLSQLNGGSGARILVGIQDIATNRNSMTSAINGIVASGSTPLAEAMQQLGRYFVEDHNNTLTMHPDTSYESRKRAYTIFDRQPSYARGVVQRSPIQYYCQKNFIILVTDGLPTSDTSISSSSGLQDYDRDCRNASPGCLSYDRKVGQFYESSGSDYLDDVATAMFDMDLRPDLTDDNGNAAKTNVLTYTIGFADQKVQNDALLRDAAGQGGGVYYTSGSSSALVDSLKEVVTSIASSINSASAATFNAANLAADSAVFLTRYNTGDWSGNLIKFPVSEQGVVGSAIWEAAPILDATNTNDRFIFTYNSDTNLGVPFRRTSNLSAAQLLDLNTAPGGGSDGRAQDRINYLNGDRSLEGSVFRKRVHLLGDTVNSSPGYVGIPESNWPDYAPFPAATGSRYSDFKQSAANRTPVVYVGDNSGFMQGYRADNGRNILSYIPSNLFSNLQGQGLHYLTDPNYQHRFYVDLSPSIQDAYVATTAGGGASWRTVLVGGERGGGRGYFALDVTDPTQFSNANADRILLWEFTSAVDADLGYTFSDVTIGLMNNGRWAAIFGNGYNNTGTGRAKLFIVYLDGGLDGVWTPGVDYVVLDTEAGTTGNLNGLSTPAAIDTDGNGTIDRIYAGDLFGNMWAFDVSGSTSGSWGSAYGNNRPQPLFRAGNFQSITARPIVVTHPTVSNEASNSPNVLVLFGTGQFITADDRINTATQALYGIWDSGEGDLRRNDLVQQEFVLDTDSLRVVTDKTVNYTGNRGQREYGWYIQLPDSGERVVTIPQVRDNIVFFTTMIPDVSGACSIGGSGWIMAVKVVNGGEPEEVVIDVTNDDQLNDLDKINNNVVSGVRFTQGIPMQSTLRGDYLFTPGSDGTLDRTRVLNDSKLLGRISWQELTGDR